MASRTLAVDILGGAFLGRTTRKGSSRIQLKGTLTVITPRSLREIAHEIIREVFEAVKGSAPLASLDGAPGLAVQSCYPDDLNASAWAESAPSS
jgi:hypothetical protein